MFRRVLIANRGEIALRVIRACRELGIETVAVYSEADEQSLHVQLADAAICIGPASSSESYLKKERIIAAAEIADVDAIHPGYGFLAEDSTFAEVCEGAKITFIGPKAATIRQMGDKAAARETAKSAGVPIVPGSNGLVTTLAEAEAAAERIGYPVLIKAVAGGGGKGMRVARNRIALDKEFESARHEAQKAFGNGAVYLERYLDGPRHIEIQVLSDSHGNHIHLGERDCSVQRRHQKLIEEAPGPGITPELRAKMGEAALRLARACNYENAGTVEFLLDASGEFYFLEMNTRIQVEHPVTEEATGIDLVKEQIRLAYGQKLDRKQTDVRFIRHAIECRVTAEDPERGFAPSPGEITLYYPPGGHGVRIDSHIYGGYVVPSHYDSMISKVIAFAATRELALERMQRALSEYLVRGIKTNIAFSRAILGDPVFAGGHATTRFIEHYLSQPREKSSEPTTPLATR